MRILYVGDLVWCGTSLQRCRALQDLGCEVVSLDIYDGVEMSQQLSFPARVMRKLGLPMDLAGVNRHIVAAMHRQTFDILWLDKGLLIKPATLRAARALQPACRIVGYSPDDMYGKHNQSRHFLQHLPLYDMFFTTKSYGVAELKQLGCPRVEFVGNAYDPHTHRPMELTAHERAQLGGEMGFIGAWEREREHSIFRLAQAGKRIRVWGTGWQRTRRRHEKSRLECRDLLGPDYAKGICSFDINLCFLRKLNRDLQTTRSIEIPACGGFMLAERTPEHMALFEEGKEAAFFSSDDELVEKAGYFLDHPEERRRIADAGRQRCITGGYDNHGRLKLMLQKIPMIS